MLDVPHLCALCRWPITFATHDDLLAHLLGTHSDALEPISFPQLADHKIIGMDDLDAAMDEFDE